LSQHSISGIRIVTAGLLAIFLPLISSAQQPAAKATSVRPAPTLPDGKVDLGGTGLWSPKWVQDWADTTYVEKAVEVPFTAAGSAKFQERRATLSKDDPEGYCMPPGVPRYTGTPYPFQIVQLKDRVLIMHESMHGYRIVLLKDANDPKKHPAPEQLNPTWLGHSVGWYEDDGKTLVVDTVGFNGHTWLDYVGHPISEDLHVVERFTRPNYGTLHYQATIEDKQMYTKPWTSSFTIPWKEGLELFEYICNENNKDLLHLNTKEWK
jgi:hypothetical protein